MRTHFNPSAGNSNTVHAGQVCIKFGGTVGGKWPTSQRGHWFPNSGDIHSLRNKIQTVCPLEKDGGGYAKQKKYKLVVYQRDISR
jgi:hypothetical protein